MAFEPSTIALGFEIKYPPIPNIPLDFPPKASDECHHAGRYPDQGGKSRIIRNNTANRKLVKQMQDIVEAEIGFRAHIDRTWNRGDDIRFEIGCVGLDSPLIVSTSVREDGRFEIHVRLLRQEFDADETWMLACRLDSVTTLRNRIGALTAQARPGLSAYEHTH